jgi:iron complex transport system ATP-binding protein
MRPVILSADGLAYAAGGNQLVADINFTLDVGEVVTILGPNGAGKSTLLKLLCGQIFPTAGSIGFHGRPLREWSSRELAQRRSVLPQQSMAPFEFTALEIVLLGRSPHGDAAQRLEMALEAMRWTECDHLALRTVNTLSGGELQRVHLARVLVQVGLESGGPSRCLMLDEPISNLDPAHQHVTLRIARRIASGGAAVLVILHDLNLAAQYSDRLVIMRNGRIVASGTPTEVVRAELIDEVFGVQVEVTVNPVCGAPAVFVRGPEPTGVAH